MYKKYFAFILLASFVTIPAFAGDAVFSNSDSEQFNLQPLNYSTVPVVNSKEVSAKSTPANYVQPKNADSELSKQNFMNAIGNLDNAQVELREQLSAYSALMAQAKTNYEAKKDEYKSYKKQYNKIKKKMRSVEKSKKIIQGNIYVNGQNKN